MDDLVPKFKPEEAHISRSHFRCIVVLLTIPLVARQGGRDEEWYQKEVAQIQTDSQYRHLDLSKVEDDIKNKVRSLEQKEKKRVKEEAARIAAAVAAVSAPPAPLSRAVASSNAEVVVSATAAVARGAARVSLSPRDQSGSGKDAASSNVASRSSTAGLDTLALVAANMSTAASTSSTSQAVALPARKCSHPDCKFVAFEPQPCTVSGCTRTIHSFCYAFVLGDPNPNSPLRCVDCIERPTNQQQIVPTTPNQQTITTNS